jgi:predicted secreted protein
MRTQYYNNNITGATVIQVPSGSEFVVSLSSNATIEFFGADSWKAFTGNGIDSSTKDFTFDSPPSGLLRFNRTDASPATVNLYAKS